MAMSEPSNMRTLGFRVQELTLGGDTGGLTESPGKGTKTAQLAARGWRILPVPVFWEARSLWHDGAGRGNPAFIDFHACHEWVVIPPDSMGIRATVLKGRVRAIRWAWAQMEGGRAAPCRRCEQSLAVKAPRDDVARQ